MNRWLAGNMLWPLTERMLGRDTLRRYRQLRRTDFAPAEQLRSIQQTKLRRLIVAVNEHCPFYRDRFASADLDVRDPNLHLNALQQLPLLERDEIRDNLDRMTWHDCPGGPAKPYNTGGSTGQPLKFFIDRCRQSADWATRFRARAWWNVRPGDRESMVWAGPRNNTSHERLRNIRDHLLNQSVLDAFNMSERTMTEYVETIRETRPRVIYGYSSSLALLARHMLATDTTLDPADAPTAIFVTGETVAPRDARDVRLAFCSPVIVEYGARDCGVIACGCEAGRLHVPMENMLVEVLNPAGKPAAPGEVGEVVLTSLESFATPMIRYRVGDLALVPADATEDGRCACGRASMQLAEVRGRVTDQIVCRDGDSTRRMHALSLIYVLREIDGVQQFRIVQQSLDAITVELVADERVTLAVEQRIIAGIRSRIGEAVAVRVERRDQIPQAASGKHVCVVSQVKEEVCVGA